MAQPFIPKIYNNNLSMSSIIDDFIQLQPQLAVPCPPDLSCQNIPRDLCKKASDNNTLIFIKNTPESHESSTKIQLQNRQYLLQIKSMKMTKNLCVTITQIQGSSFKKILSRNVQLELMRQLSSQQHQFQNQALYSLHRGRLTMTLATYFHFSSLPRKKFIDLYNQIIIKNVHHYHQFLHRHFKDNKTSVAEQEKEGELHEDLAVLMMMTTQANFDYSEATSQFNLSEASLKRQKLQLKNILENIILEKELERNVDSLFLVRLRENSSQWAKDNLMHLSDCHQRKHKNSLQVKRLGQKKLDDFVYNMAKVELKERSNKPIAEGGSSHIYRAKVLINFLNSFDSSLHKPQDDRVEKMVAVKSIKEEYEAKLRPKLEHEKNIVVKLRGSVTYFLPKYYGTQSPEFNNCLLMQMLNGESLDLFVHLRSATISFKTKIYLLLNVIYGLHHLIKYQIVHLDLKPTNIIVCRQLITKIIDFGQAYHHDVCAKDYCPGFTFPYVAPEVYSRYESKMGGKRIQPLQFSQKQDSFAFGMIIYQIMFSSKLFQLSPQKCRPVYHQRSLFERIFLAAERLQNYGEALIMSALLTLVGRCIDPNPENRPKFDWIAILFKIMLNSYKSH